jgi:hypothetical protein
VTSRRFLCWVALLAASVHGVGIARTLLPAQDGLKFLRVAREFQAQPWEDVVRNTDQHPLYPAAIAFVQPLIAVSLGPGPDAWRIAAQVVSALASIALLWPLFPLSRSLFDEPTARLTVLLIVLLPGLAAVGHDTLSDSLALLSFTTALWLAEVALRTQRLRAVVGCAIAAGCGFWTRPEIAVLPVAIGLTALLTVRSARAWDRLGRVATLGVVFLAMVGSYALVKGEVSEKLALRRAIPAPEKTRPIRTVPQWLPPGLDDPRWDFSAKEESLRPAHVSPTHGALEAIGVWAEGMGWVLAPLAVWAAWRVRAGGGRRLIGIYVLLFGVVLVRHAMSLGYLSSRHGLTLVVATLPWAAAGALAAFSRLADRWGWDEEARRRKAALALAALVGVALLVQSKPAHASRWGHWAAGRWLEEHTRPGDPVLDTRGWAAFVSGRPSYDYWHVRQALTDANLAYIVVGTDELAATSRRGATLRAVLAYAAEPVAAFPEHAGGHDLGVWVYRFRHPASWEGLAP